MMKAINIYRQLYELMMIYVEYISKSIYITEYRLHTQSWYWNTNDFLNSAVSIYVIISSGSEAKLPSAYNIA